MAKNNKVLFIVVAVALIGFVFVKGDFLGAVTGVETMTRTSSVTTIPPGQTFTLNYNAIGTSGTWGASIQDAVSGGCTFPSGSSSYKTVMLSEDGTTKSITMTAPSSAGTCTFTGDYQYGTSSIKTFSSLNVNICAALSCNSMGKNCGTWSNGCGTNLNCGTCTSPNVCNATGQCACTPVCTRPSDLCLVTSSNGCSGTCTWTVTKNGVSDTNCDNLISRTEVGTAINNWIAGTMSRADLASAIQVWANA